MSLFLFLYNQILKNLVAGQKVLGPTKVASNYPWN